MTLILNKIFSLIFLNTSLFLMLIIGIQNSSMKSKVNFLIYESINLPVSFILGVSFLCGSTTGGLLTLNISKQD
tara:strand:+ start:197 stop:418 length:222 start_codon:yes stop_codon:yes gene_type:complete